MVELRPLAPAGTAPAITLRDVDVVPATAEPNNLPVGGVLWPEDAPSWVHPHRYGRAVVNSRPARPAVPDHVLDAASYLGYATSHFGHFLAEQAGRVLDTSRYDPRGRGVLVARPQHYQATVSGFIWDVLEWLGVERASVEVVASRAVRVKEFTVWRTQESPGVSPSERYLDVLDENTARRQLVPVPNRVLYVSRSRMPHRLSGELYLDEALRSAGVRVLHPETLPLWDQLAHYGGARTLVFAEGSSMHGRQLLGRVDQRIVVLQRRKGGSFGKDFLTSRASGLDIVDPLHCSIPLSFRFDAPGPKMWEAFPLVDSAKILATFAELGVDLAASWDEAAFQRLVRQDLEEWAQRMAAAYVDQDAGERLQLGLSALAESGQERYGRVLRAALGLG